MNKKILLSLGAMSSLVMAPALTIACGRNKAGYLHAHAPKESVVKVNLKNEYKLEKDKIKDAPSIIMINDGGDINDKSFNQSAWEGVLKFADVQNEYPSSKIGVLDVKDEKYQQAYQYALAKGYRIWVAPGFLHAEHLTKFFENADNVRKFKENKAKIIGADYDIPLKLESHWQSFKTKEAAFIAGYAAAKFLSEEDNKENRTFTSFGGGVFRGVTDFIEGFYKGVHYWNTLQKEEKTKVYSTQESVNLTTGFDATKDAMKTVVSAATATKAKIILPVAGPATFLVTKDENFKGKGKYVIGVDTDQALATKVGVETFFTSILKNLGQSTYDAVGLLGSTADWSTIQDKLGTPYPDANDRILSGGIKENWVDVSETHITGDKKAKAEAALKEAKEVFLKLVQDNSDVITLLNSNKATKEGTEYTDKEPGEKIINELAKLLILK
ncbi:BMP family ABC transporter substrate-binding protein [Mycoplasmopsis opalescens]|uniref:BMP family ABC transporter substrate-binding protein n=1 Tax=Mycoplasmopsis opalescens TaxID=114886 RepID=UPI0004A75767|nr:BMP family ABC transporter substrate-binding protein [Mycoplasmopsis opalescens]